MVATLELIVIMLTLHIFKILLCVDYPHCNSLPSLSSLTFLQTTLARTRESRSEDIEKQKLLITGMGWSIQVQCKKSNNVWEVVCF